MGITYRTKNEINMGKVVSFDAPNKDESSDKSIFKVFLGGTIDNGDSVDWQHKIINTLKEREDDIDVELHVLNPRRDNWKEDSNEWMEGQVTWELENQEKSDLIVMNIEPKSKSPISLLEIGLNAKDDKLAVFCTEEFYRFNNIRITCARYGVPLIKNNDIDSIINYIIYKANKKKIS